MLDYDDLYIAGSWQRPSGTEKLSVVDPTSEAVYARVPAGVGADIDVAVAAAAEAFGDWSQTGQAERARFLSRVSEALRARDSEFADVITHELGMPRDQSLQIQVGMAIDTFAIAAEVAAGFAFEQRPGALLVFEPVGVVGCITPWNYPLNQIAAKVAYALAAGCTVVLKPSELAPVNAFMLADLMDHVGLPPGVFNVVSGLGPLAGEALASHGAVDMVSFTGSTRAGRRVAALAADTVKRVALELGGKSPNLLLEDADFVQAVPAGVANAFANSGQTCDALTRMLVPRNCLAQVEELAQQAAESFVVGDPFVPGTRLGPLVSAAQQERVRDYIRRGRAEGAKLLTGGEQMPNGIERGFFVEPTVFSEVRRDMVIAREEIFGPVLSILPYDSEDEAVDIANDTVYGLSSAVSGSPEAARRVARRIRAGQVHVNRPPYITGSPFGGYKQSGIGREHGIYGLQEFLETKAIFT